MFISLGFNSAARFIKANPASLSFFPCQSNKPFRFKYAALLGSNSKLLLICSIAKSTLAGLAPVNPEFDPYTCRLADNSLKIA